MFFRNINKTLFDTGGPTGIIGRPPPGAFNGYRPGLGIFGGFGGLGGVGFDSSQNGIQHNGGQNNGYPGAYAGGNGNGNGYNNYNGGPYQGIAHDSNKPSAIHKKIEKKSTK